MVAKGWHFFHLTAVAAPVRYGYDKQTGSFFLCFIKALTNFIKA
jgi:hypothetical protein